MSEAPCIVGIGGTTRPNSTTERALRVAMHAASATGADTRVFGGRDLAELPMYNPDRSNRSELAQEYVEELRHASGIILASPGYHGSISGMVKNALDYTEDLRDDGRPYFDGIAVGCIAIAGGWQAVYATISALRSIVHALRGWPTPLGAAINSSLRPFDENGCCVDEKVRSQLETIGRDVVTFARMRELVDQHVGSIG